MIFLGEYEHRVDPQGRISIPSRFRDSFRGGIILARGYDRCIVAYTPSEWANVANHIASMPITQNKARRMMRLTFSGAFQLQPDRQGRVPLPPPLRQYAGAQEEVMVVGAGRYLEIWDKELWARERALLDETAWQIAEKLEERG